MRNKNGLSALTIGILISISTPASAMDIKEFFKGIFSVRAGSKAIDNSEGKDIEKFLEPNKCANLYPWGAPKFKDPEIAKQSLYICRNSYAVQYNHKHKVPLWTAEIINKNNIANAAPYAGANYQVDPEIPSKMQANMNDFAGTNYTMANLAPTSNMVTYSESLMPEQLLAINKKAMEEGYYLTNVGPMVTDTYRGIWTELELQIRQWTMQKNEMFVTTGSLYLNGKPKAKLGKSEIDVPTHYYKVITHPISYGSVAYIIPNKEIVTFRTKKIRNPSDAYYCGAEKRACEIGDFIVSIKELERVSGIEFYPRLAPYYSVQVKQDINEIFKYKRK